MRLAQRPQRPNSFYALFSTALVLGSAVEAFLHIDTLVMHAGKPVGADLSALVLTHTFPACTS
jgi:hypothetical protein